ncbi:MAG: calcium-binding protein [Pseudomonadota bacterium]
MTTVIENGDFPDGTVPGDGSPITDVFEIFGDTTLFGGLTGSSLATFDTDAFDVILSDGDVLTLTVESDQTSADPIPSYEAAIFDETLTQVAAAVTSTDFEVLTLTYAVPETTSISDSRTFFSLNGFFEGQTASNPVATGSYRIRAEVVREDHGAFLETATAVAPGDVVASVLASPEDVDVFSLDLAAGTRLTVDLQGFGAPVLTQSPEITFLSGVGVQLGAATIDERTYIVDVLSGGVVGARLDTAGALFELTFNTSLGVEIGDVGGQVNQTILGFEGDDTLLGGAGDDVLAGGGGSDSNQGGAGRDTVDFRDSPGGVSVRLNQGVGFLSDASGDTFAGIEDVLGSGSDDFIVGEDGANRLVGRDGADELRGLGGDDLLLGRAGADTLLGQAGVDTLFGGAGDDDLDGAQGGGLISGGAGNDIVEGGSGADTLFGGAGNDTLEGEGGSDLLFGGAGGDVLLGGSGADRLNGGGGGDLLTGGAGADVFVYSAGRDTISDFEAGDRIDLSDLLAVSGFDNLVVFDNGGSDRGIGFAPDTGLAGQVLLPVFDLGALDAVDFIFAS